jgi:hypothetical protein
MTKVYVNYAIDVVVPQFGTAEWRRLAWHPGATYGRVKWR